MNDFYILDLTFTNCFFERFVDKKVNYSDLKLELAAEIGENNKFWRIFWLVFKIKKICQIIRQPIKVNNGAQIHFITNRSWAL